MIETVFIFASLLVVALLLQPFSIKYGYPFSSLLVVVGFVGSEMLVAFGVDTGLRWDSFVEIVLHVLVPIIVFESAFNANASAIRMNIGLILTLAMPLMLLAAIITGILLYRGIGHESGFPLISALLAGVILSATDPAAVVDIFKKVGAPDRLNALIEGESLFNDVTAIVIYSLLISMAINGTDALSPSESIWLFLKSAMGGTLIGLLMGYCVSKLYKLTNNYLAYAIFGCFAAIVAFYLAEHVFDVSGIVSVLMAGLYLGDKYKSDKDIDSKFAEKFWELNAFVANAILFILVGVTITVAMFTGQWLSMLIGIAAATVARSFIIYGCLPLVTLLPAIKYINLDSKNVLMWGGLRGAVSLALALSIPTEVPGWYTIQSIVYGVVIFTLFIQAPFMEKLVLKTLKTAKLQS